MEPYITTIEELRSKPTSELWALFCRAAEYASSAGCPENDRKAAEKTVENIRAVLRYRAMIPGPR